MAAVASEIPTAEVRYFVNETYLLPADEAEKARLDAQHFAVQPYSNGLVPPMMVVKEGDTILDAGTGTGVWLQEVAKVVPPGVSLVGMDIEGRLFPSPAKDMRFFVGSTLDLPHELDSTFTLVHQRLMVAAFSEDGWKKAISCFYRVLKPGGYLKLEEVDFMGAFSKDMVVPPLSRKFGQGLRALCAKRGINMDTLTHVTGFMKEVGFEIVDESRVMTYLGEDPTLRRTWIAAWKAMKDLYVRTGLIDGAKTNEEYDKFMDEVEEEWRVTNCTREWCNWTARKPL